MKEQKEQREIFEIAIDIANDWGINKVNYAAKPYLAAMLHLKTIDQKYIFDSADSIVRYFLSNASAYRTKKAKTLKQELKNLLK